MNQIFTFIHWNVSPEIFRFGVFSVRWYGVLFASGFLIAYQILTRIFANEGKRQVDLDSLTLYIISATVLGARLGHCLFYSPEYYLSNPLEILKVWEGGLASHGAAIGILTALWLYSRSRADQSFLWAADRVVIFTALAGCLIRLGNLMNSEIVGKATDVPWAFIFARLGDGIPRHPTQIYEAASYLSIFIFLYFSYRKRRERTPEGLLLGWFLVLVFLARFVLEFLKENQEKFESTLPLNMGQILSIPLILLGIFLLLRAKSPKKIEEI